MDLMQLVRWDTLITSLLLSSIIWLIKRGEAKRDEARAEARREEERRSAAEEAWRTDIEQRMADFEKALENQNTKIDSVLKGQITQMRSDIVHKAHRYLDDLGCASTDEKNAFDEEFKDYVALCEAYDIENDFVNTLHDQVKALPGRAIERGRKEQ